MRKIYAVLAGVMVLFSGEAMAVDGAGQTTKGDISEIKIKAQPLDKALSDLGQQLDTQIVVFSDDAAQFRAKAIEGRFTDEEAIALILQDSGLQYRHITDDMIAVGSSERLAENIDKLKARVPGSTSTGRDSGAQVGPTEAQEREVTEDTEGPQAVRRKGQPEDLMELEEIVVTGSHIRGIGLSVGSKVNVIDRLDIDRSGFSSTQQVLQSLPQVFQGGPNEDTFLGAASSNNTSASSVNLRGLGADSTLFLVNGRRVPVAGMTANFTDISNIPVTAIERIEILPDGASAVYGSDAVAGVVNVILRDDYEGAETRLRFGSVTEGSLQEYQVGQTFGTSWDKGHALISYEYFKRDPLPNLERDFAANSDLRPLGGDNFSDTFSNPGNIVSLATFAPTFAIPTGQDGTSLMPGDLLMIGGAVEPNFNNKNEGRNLLQGQERHSVFAAASQELSDRIEISAEGRFSQRDFNRRVIGQAAAFLVTPVNPFFVDAFGGGMPYFMFYNLVDDFGGQRQIGDVKSYNGVLASTVKLGRDWEAKFYGSYSQEDSFSTLPNSINPMALQAAVSNPDPALAFNPYADGSSTSAAVLQSLLLTEESTDLTTSKVWSLNLVADGTVAHIPGGAVKLAVGTDFRKEMFDLTLLRPTFVIESGRRDTSIGREVFAAFAELYIPLFSEENRRAGLEGLAVSIAGRFEDYNDSGTTTNPKLGVVWTPLEGLNIRSTWGKSFKAPNLTDRDRSQNLDTVLLLTDPTAPSGSIFAVTRSGRAENLQNEKATTWTAGFDFAPTAVPGFKVDLTYFNIDFKDRLNNPRNLGSVLLEEERFTSIIDRDLTAEDLDAVCNSEFFDPLSGFGDCTLPIEAIVDARLRNTSQTNLSGLDFNIYYGFETASIGRFDFHLNGNYLIDFDEQFDATAPIFQLVDTVNNPVDFRMRNSLTWSNTQGMSITAFLNYVDSYTDNLSVPERKVDSWTSVDLTLSYNSRDSLSIVGLNDTVFSLNALNLFNSTPPFVNNPQGVGYDPENADPLGRFIAFNVTKKW